MIKIFSGSQNTYRDFVWVGDVVSVITKKYDSGIYDLGCSTSISFLDVAEMVAEKYNSTIKFIPMPDIIKGKYQRYTIAKQEFAHEFMQVQDFIQNHLE